MTQLLTAVAVFLALTPDSGNCGVDLPLTDCAVGTPGVYHLKPLNMTSLPVGYPNGTSCVYVVDQSIHQVANSSFADLHWLSKVILNRNNISTVDIAAFLGTNVTHLLMAHNQLRHVPNMADTAETLQILDLSSNLIEDMADCQFVGFDNLREVHLRNNLLATLPDMSVIGHSLSIRVDVRSNRISQLPTCANNNNASSAEHAPAPRYFLKNNAITSIRGTSVTIGKTLKLSGNYQPAPLDPCELLGFSMLRLLNWPYGNHTVFPDLRVLATASWKLTELNLDNNRFAGFSSCGERPVDRVCWDSARGRAPMAVRLQNNQLDAMPDLTTIGPVISALRLAHNRIQFVAPCYFRSMPNLYALYLSYNKFRSLPDWSHAGLNTNMLATLYMIGNGLADPEKTAFCGLTGLRWLDLSYNNITRLPDLRNATSLDMVCLSHNLIHDSPLLVRAPYLHLYLSYNRLTRVPVPINPFTAWFNMILSHNDIDAVHDAALCLFDTMHADGATYWTAVDLRYNRLQILPNTLKFTERRLYLRVAGNPVVCNCSNLHVTSSTYLDLGDTTCSPDTQQSEPGAPSDVLNVMGLMAQANVSTEMCTDLPPPPQLNCSAYLSPPEVKNPCDDYAAVQICEPDPGPNDTSCYGVVGSSIATNADTVYTTITIDDDGMTSPIPTFERGRCAHLTKTGHGLMVWRRPQEKIVGVEKHGTVALGSYTMETRHGCLARCVAAACCSFYYNQKNSSCIVHPTHTPNLFLIKDNGWLFWQLG